MVYEALLLAALLFAAALAFLLVIPQFEPVVHRLLLQAYLLLVGCAYFVWCWRRGGQTLPMKTWRLKLVGCDGAAVTLGRAIARCLLLAVLVGCVAVPLTWGVLHGEPVVTLAGSAVALATFGWAWIDRDRQFLHDRLVGTRIIRVAP